MFAFMPTGLAPWEVVAFSGLCAMTVLGVAISVGVTVAYLSTRPRRTVRYPAPARAAAPGPRPTGAIPPVVAMGRAAG